MRYTFFGKPFIILAAIVFIASCGKNGRQKISAQTASVKVKLVEVNRGDLVKRYHFVSKVEPSRSTTVSAEVSGKVIEVFRDEGEKISEGDTLVLLDDRDYRSRLEEARSLLENRETEYNRVVAETERDRRLFEERIISVSEWELSQARKTAAASALDSARERTQQAVLALGRTKILAPTGGVAAVRFVNKGDYIVGGSPLFRIDEIEPFRCRINLPRELDFLREGYPVRISRNGNYVRGRVLRQAGTSSSVAGTREWIVECGDNTFLWQSGVRVSIEIEHADFLDALLIPVTAIRSVEKGYVCYTVGDDRVARQVPIRVIDRFEELAAVTGLKEGQRVVAKLSTAVKDGGQVEVIE